MRAIALLLVSLGCTWCFRMDLTLAPSNSTFDQAAFLSGLASQLNNIKAERLSVIADPTKLPSGHRQLSVRVSDEGDHDALKKKVMMLPFRHKAVAGFSDVEVVIHEETPGKDGVPPRPPPPPERQVLKLGCIFDLSPSEFRSAQAEKIAKIEETLGVPTGSMAVTDLHAEKPGEAFHGPAWVQLQARQRSSGAKEGVSVVFDMKSADDHLLDAAIMRVVDLPWAVPHLISVGAGTTIDRSPVPEPTTPVPEGERCGSKARELCLALVIEGTAHQASNFKWLAKLAHYLRIHPKRLRFISHGEVTQHPSWADIKVDKEYVSEKGGKMVQYAVTEETAPPLDAVHSHMAMSLFHAAELMRISAGFAMPQRRASWDGHL